jgi:hypothetical protein
MPVRFRLTTLAAACALALLSPATAGADDGQVVNDPTLAQYMRIAAGYWGAPEPHCEGPDGQSISPYAVMADDPNPSVAAWAEMPGCRIWLDADYWPAPPSEQYCNLIAHEWGHLLGYPHSEDSHNLMWVSGPTTWSRAASPTGGRSSRRDPRLCAAPKKKKRKLGDKAKRGSRRCAKAGRSNARRHGKTVKRHARKRCPRARQVARRRK